MKERSLRFLGILLLAFLPEYYVVAAQADVEPDVGGQMGWACWSAKNEVAAIRVQVTARMTESRERSYHMRIASSSSDSGEKPVMIASFDTAKETVDSDRIIYSGTHKKESAELRIHPDLRSEMGKVSNLIYEREENVLDSAVPVLSVIQLECAETRLP